MSPQKEGFVRTPPLLLSAVREPMASWRPSVFDVLAKVFCQVFLANRHWGRI
jgi:hypothetical protein